MKRIVAAAVAAIMLLAARDGLALCGDVNGDGQRKASDALAVLRAAVGQAVDLVCEAGPSRLRFFNDFQCETGSSVSEARFNGFTFTADSSQFSDYQVVDRTQIDTMEIDVCGGTYAFPGPLNLPPNRSLTFFMLLLDPAFYGDGSGTPAEFVIYDDGAPADALTAGTASGQSNVVRYGYGVITPSPR